MASAFGPSSHLILDGKCMRSLWADGHGDGDPSSYLVESTIGTMEGHPSWKVFCGNVPEPIVRNKNEPPHYVYLDDRACYAVWMSQQYSNEELTTFWPFDFDNVGRIITGRPNRGRPANFDDSCLDYAKGTLRNEYKMSQFYGSPELANAPARPMNNNNTNDEKEAELIGENNTTLIATPHNRMPNTILLSEAVSPSGDALHNSEKRSLRPKRKLGTGQTPSAIEGSPYLETSAVTPGSRPRHRSRDLAVTLGELSENRRRMEELEEGVLVMSTVIKKPVAKKKTAICQVGEGVWRYSTKITKPNPKKRKPVRAFEIISDVSDLVEQYEEEV
jgi:hypothetical protein